MIKSFIDFTQFKIFISAHTLSYKLNSTHDVSYKCYMRSELTPHKCNNRHKMNIKCHFFIWHLTADNVANLRRTLASLCKFYKAANLGLWKRLLQTLMAANVFYAWKKIYRTSKSPKSKTIAQITIKQNKINIEFYVFL